MAKLLNKLPYHIDADLCLPGSKSFTNRAIILATQIQGKTVLQNFSDCDDTQNMIKALKNLGIKFSQTGRDLVIDVPQNFAGFSGKIDCGPSGTTVRFLTAFLATTENIEIELTGNQRLRERPIQDLVEALQTTGADIKYLENEGKLPLLIKGKKLNSAKFSVKGGKSSQFLSALMLLAPHFGKLEIDVREKLVSKSYVQITIDVLKEFGFEVKNDNFQKFIIKKSRDFNHLQKINIETDLSGASYFWAIGALNGQVKLRNINPQTSQGDLQFVDFLEQMGAKISRDFDSITVQATEKLQEITVNMENCPDVAQTLAVVASFAEGETTLTGLSTLKVKETDRLAATQNELKKMVIKTEIGDDFIKIYGGQPNPAKIKTYHDHRMAMAFAVASVKIDGLEIENPEVVSKSFPNFWEKLKIATSPRNYSVMTKAKSRELLGDLDNIQTRSNYIELRTDYIETLDKDMVKKLREKTYRSHIFTCRRADEGGHWQKSEKERLEILNFAKSLDFDLIDIEYQTAVENPDWFKKFNPEKVLLSWHDFEQTPDLEEIYQKMQQFPAKIYKIIPTAQSPADNQKVYDFLEKFAENQRIICFTMGKIGQETRIKGFEYGNFAGYLAVDGQGSAEGQLGI